MEHAAFHLWSAGLNPKVITIWRSFGGIPVTSRAVLGPKDRVLTWQKVPLCWHSVCSSHRRGEGGQGKERALSLLPSGALGTNAAHRSPGCHTAASHRGQESS